MIDTIESLQDDLILEREKHADTIKRSIKHINGFLKQIEELKAKSDGTEGTLDKYWRGVVEELRTRDVLEQVDARLGNACTERGRGMIGRVECVEQDMRGLRSVMNARFSDMNGRFSDMDTRFAELNIRFEQLTRWFVGLLLVSWLSLMASIWLKP